MTTEEEIAALKQATREAHEARSDLQLVIKEAKKYFEEELKDKAETIIKMHVTLGLQEYSRDIKTAIDKATQAVYNRFDKIVDTMLGEDKASKRQGRPSIPELMKKVRDK